MAGRIKTIPSLKDFMMKSQVTSLYRSALRTTYGLDEAQRREIRNFVRHEFELSSKETDPNQISFLLTTGKRRVQQLATQLAMTR